MESSTLTALRISLGLDSSQRYLFLFSHMRSYSSLLAHLLGSSPHIDGYGEMHIRYRNHFDLLRLRRAVERSTGKRASGEWLLDKLLHNNLKAPDRLLGKEQIRAIIFLRDPEAALRSTISLGVHCGETLTRRYMQSICDYYVARLHRLRADGERLQQRALYLDSEALVQRSKQVLLAISNWLELPTALSERYDVRQRSGEIGFGDPSTNILAGRVLGKEASTIERGIIVPNEIVNEARAAYARCRASLLSHCHVNANCLRPDAARNRAREEQLAFKETAFV